MAIPHERLLGPVPVEEFTAWARNVFLHQYTPGSGDVIFDVGAGRGAEALLFSRLVGPNGRVVSLEAHPATYGWLTRLCRGCGLTNVIPLQVAASAAEGELTITDSDVDLTNTVLAADGEECIRVPARTLDEIAQEYELAQVNLLKMNIEDAERLAIQGMSSLIERTQHVCIGCHDFLADRGAPDSMRTKALVREFLLDHGFQLTTRETAGEPWMGDYLYGVNPRIAAHT